MSVSRPPRHTQSPGRYRLQTYRNAGYATVGDPTNVGALSNAPHQEATAGWSFDDGTDPCTPVWVESVYDETTSSWSYNYLTAPGGVAYTAVGNIIAECDDVDIEIVQNCYQDQDDSTLRYTQLLFVNGDTTAIIGTTWLDADGVVLATAPANIILCSDLPTAREVVGGEKIMVDEAATVSLTVPADATHARVFVKAHKDLLVSAKNGNIADQCVIEDLVRISINTLPLVVANDDGEEFQHQGFIELHSVSEMVNFQAIARTDSAAFGSDIRPTLWVTYFDGIA